MSEKPQQLQDQEEHFTAWLEREDGSVLWLNRDTDSTIGRSDNNSIILSDSQISRNHALVRPEPGKGFLLMDLGSTNGTYLNHLKIHKPTLLRDRDRVEIGNVRMLYRESRYDAEKDSAIPVTDATVFRVAKIPCFLVLVDIEGFTTISQGSSTEKLARDLDEWTSGISKIVTDQFGIINQYLGDAVFAFWEEASVRKDNVLLAIDNLISEQRTNRFRFRVVVHYGEARIGAGTFSGVDSIIGKQVNFLFRMERLCSSLKLPNLLSKEAVERLDLHHRVISAESHAVKDFSGKHPFFVITDA